MEFPVGIKPIREMTREEMIAEIITNQQAQLAELSDAKLKHMIADFRVTEATKRIHAEAGLTVRQGIFGSVVMSEEEAQEEE